MQVRDGHLIYSPNSNRSVDIPSHLSYGHNPFSPGCKPGTTKTNYWKLDVSVFELPQWYHTMFGWVCMYDRNTISSTSPLINTLWYSSSRFAFDDSTSEYMLPVSLRDDWLRLERQLSRAFKAIHHHYPVHAYAAPGPHVFGYLCAHKTRGHLSLSLQKLKAWFGLHMAILSFNIAAAECTHAHAQSLDGPSLREPSWQDLILEYGEDLGMDCVWLDMLLDTSIASFSPGVSRTGTFIMLNHTSPYEAAPSVDWFVQYGVPVWYEWNSAQASDIRISVSHLWSINCKRGPPLEQSLFHRCHRHRPQAGLLIKRHPIEPL